MLGTRDICLIFSSGNSILWRRHSHVSADFAPKHVLVGVMEETTHLELMWQMTMAMKKLEEKVMLHATSVNVVVGSFISIQQSIQFQSYGPTPAPRSDIRVLAAPFFLTYKRGETA